MLTDTTSSSLCRVVRLPVPCDELAVVRITEARQQDDSRPFPGSPDFRQFLLGLHHSSHRLFAAHLPTTAEGEVDPAAAIVLMDLCSSFRLLPGHLLATSMRKVLVTVSTTTFDPITYSNATSGVRG